MLKVAAIAVIGIALLDAVCFYAEKYLTTSVGQWVMHDLRWLLYAHIQHLSLDYHNQKQTGELISRLTSDIDAIQSFIVSSLLGFLVDGMTLVGMAIDHVLPELALHPDRPLRRAPAFRGDVLVHAAQQEGLARSQKKESEIVSRLQEVLVVHWCRQSTRPGRLRAAKAGGRERAKCADCSPRAQSQSPALALGWDHRGGRDRPGALVRGQAGPRRIAFCRFADRFHLVPGKDVQAHAGLRQDDGHLFEGGGGI